MKQLQVLLVLFALALLAACGGGKKAVTITVSPTTVSIYTTQNQQFAATITNATSTAATWEVNGIAGGNSVVGTIDATGLYTAPAALPVPATVNITATATADTTKTATAIVTLLQGANLAITPSNLTLNAGAQQTFTVSSTGVLSPSGTTYSLSCKSTAPLGCGSITADGVFTAPSLPPPGGNVIVTATVTVNTATFNTSATVTIVGASQGTAGQYAFSLSGKNNGSSYHAAGSITLDGNGHITGGFEDINNQGSVSSVTFTGGTYTYSVADGRIAANVTTSNGTATFYMVLVDASRGFIEYAGSGISASGTLNLQDATKFSTAASVNGPYVFRLSGLNTGSSQSLGETGAFTADGNGNLTSGLLDANSGGDLTSGASVTGTFTAAVAPTGRGTLTLSSSFGTQNFAYYLVDATQFKFVETDAAYALSGDAVQQTASSFTNGSFNGTLATVLSGVGGTTSFGLGGMLTISNGTVVGGTVDRNNSGIFTGGQTVTGGSYTVDPSTGRAALTVNLSSGTVSLVLYPQNNSAFYVLDASTSESGSGLGYVTSGATFSLATIHGNYAIDLTGNVGSTPEDAIGALNANGGGAFTGTLDITNSGANTTLQSSPYTVSASGATATLKSSFANFNSVGFKMYIVDATRVLFLENDTKGVLTGLMQLQQ